MKIKPRLYILAGANGSGKSTISKVLLPSEGLVYVNPDDIAKELSPDRYSRSKYNLVSLYSGMADHWLLYYNGGTDFSLVAHGIALPEQFLRFGFLFRGGFAAWVDIFGTALPYGDIVPCMTDETVGFALRGKLRRFAIVTSWLYLSTNTTEKI